MTEQEKIKKALSGLRASGDTLTEVLKMTTRMGNETSYKKRITGKRAAVFAVAAVLALALGVGALAYSGIITSWSGFSNPADAYTSLPTAQQAVRDGGYAPVLIESFENGYAFESGLVMDNALEEAVGGPAVERFKSFEFTYEKDGDSVTFSQMRYESEMDYAGEIVDTVDGTGVRYYSYRQRFVDADYQLTPEEQAEVDAGELVFGYGIEDPGVHTVQCVTWETGDMHYALTQIDGALRQDALVDMAAEVITRG